MNLRRMLVVFAAGCWVPLANAAQGSCTVDQLAGTYQSSFGDLRCTSEAGKLVCCYGNAQSCDQKLDLKLSRRGNKLSGKWLYSNGRSGPARFDVTDDCHMDDGFWGAGRQANAPWSVQWQGESKPKLATRASTPAASRQATATRTQTATRKPPEQTPGTGIDVATGLRIERSLAALGFDPGPVDGVVDDATNKAVVAWQNKTRHETRNGLTVRQLAVLEQQAADAIARKSRRAALDAQGPLARFSKQVERNNTTVMVDTGTRCDETAEPMVVIADSLESLPESGQVLGALQYATRWVKPDCRRNWKRFDVAVLTQDGSALDERYMFLIKAQPALILPYSILSDDYLDFLKKDPGYPFARVAPPLINIASGLWEREFTRGGWAQSMGGDAHWQTIAFQFALADAQMCKDVVGRTASYKHTITQTDEYGAITDSQSVTYEFDADWEPIILAILERGNHIGRPIGTGARRLIRTYGCTSEEVARLRRNPITVAAKTLNLPLPPGAGHVQQ